MNILSIDTTSQNLSCAIISDENLIAEFSLFNEKTHSERLMPLIGSLLKAAGMEIGGIDFYACAVGPGSFTGLRIGISTVKGLAFANNKKVIAVSSLDALSMNAPATKYLVCPLIDARKGEVFSAFYECRSLGDDISREIIKKTDEFNLTPEELVKKIRKKTLFLGNGAILYEDIIRRSLKDKALFVPGELNCIKGLNVARIAAEKIKKGEAVPPDELVPVYIRESDAVINFKG